MSSSRAGSLSVTIGTGAPSAGTSRPRTKTSRPGHGQRSAPSAGSNVVRPISTASQLCWNAGHPWVWPGTKSGSATSAGQPSGVVT
ncbi:MAG: hypothetical protein ACHP9Z_11185 [Streptosporangiales bacterium]